MFRCHEPKCLLTQLIPTLLNTGFSIYYWHEITPKYALIIISLQIAIALGIQRSIFLISLVEREYIYALIITLLFFSVFIINLFSFKVQAQNYFFIITESIFLFILFLNLVTITIISAVMICMLIVAMNVINQIANHFRQGQMRQNQQELQLQEITLRIDGLLTCPYSNLRNQKYNICPICLQEFNQNDQVSYLSNCAHIFHQQCISVWLQENQTCPYCRAIVEETI